MPLESVIRLCLGVSKEEDCARLAELVRERRGPPLQQLSCQPSSIHEVAARAYLRSDGFSATVLSFEHLMPPDEAAEIKRGVSRRVAAHMEHLLDRHLADADGDRGGITAWLQGTTAFSFSALETMYSYVSFWYHSKMATASDALLACIMEREMHGLTDTVGPELARRIVGAAFDIEAELDSVACATSADALHA